jgi:hypothetical protein
VEQPPTQLQLPARLTAPTTQQGQINAPEIQVS